MAVRKGSRGAAGLLLSAALAAPATGQQPPVCEGGRTALVLSGGGAKGIAHVAVLEALDRLGARPDLVVGTSMGALVGALYASGYTGREVDSIARATPADRLFASGTPRVPRPWRALVPLLTWERGAQGFALQSPALRETDANAALAALLLTGNLRARGSFDSLPIPFRAVATDLASREPVVLGDGDLAQAIRASIAVPLLFSPERTRGLVLSDGGLSANVPVTVARALGATRVIVSDVSGRLLDRDDLSGPVAVAEQLAAFLFQQPADTLGPDDVHVKIGVEDFRALDFRPAMLDSIRAHGRRAADSILPRARCLPRAEPATAATPTRVASFTVRDRSPAEARRVGRLLGIAQGETLDPARLRRRLARFGDLDGFKAIWLNPSRVGDSVAFHAEVQPGPSRLAGGTFAYDNDLGGRLGVAYLERRLLGSALEAAAVGGFSRRRTDFTLGLRRYFGLGRSRLAPAVEARVVEEFIPLYTTDGTETGRPISQDAVLFAGLEHAVGSDWTVRLGAEGRLWRDADTSLQGSARRNGQSAGLAARVVRYPGDVTILADAIWTGTFRRLHADVAANVRLGKLGLTPRLRVGWGEGLPMQARFRLGGNEGFPGLAVEELRGDRELVAAVQGTWPLRGPLSARLLVAGGRSALGGTLVDGHGWIGGARAGLGVSTPLGPVRVEYGAATTGRDNLFVRIGRWF